MADDVNPNKGIDIVNPGIAAYSERWSKVRDALEGEEAVHKAGAKYLPKLKEESAKDYGARKGRTPWYNASARTHEGLHGMLFRKEPQVTAPEGLKPYLNDVTLTGVPFNNFAKDVGKEVLGPGVCGVLVDHPPAPDTQGRPLTVAMAEALGLRPTMAL